MRAVVDRGWSVPADARIVMHVIIFGEEPVTEDPGFGLRIERIGQVMDAFERLELCFGKRVVVGDPRP